MKNLMEIINGAILGITAIIPGVSCATMAIILGLYDNLIRAISGFYKDWKKHVLFLVKVGIGAVVGVLAFSKLITMALDNFEFPMIYLFLGLIIGGLPLLFKKVFDNSHTNEGKKYSKYTDYIFLVIGFSIILLITMLPEDFVSLATNTGIQSFIFNIIAGIVVAIALILPGLSAAFVLLTIGLYEVSLEAISSFDFGYLIPIGIGGLIGAFITAKVLEKFLDKYPRKTYLLILGFVLASIIAVFPGLPTGMEILYCVVSFLIGITLIICMGKIKSKEKAD